MDVDGSLCDADEGFNGKQIQMDARADGLSILPRVTLRLVKNVPLRFNFTQIVFTIND